MSSLTYTERERIARFLGFKGGYVFTFLKSGYTKTNTRDMIYAATGIDIYKNTEYDMSQERCIRKIWDECDDYTVGKLLKIMLDYYWNVAEWNWDRREETDYQELRELEKRLMQNPISIPAATTDTLKLVKEDIERSCNNNIPELALDRLHTFSTEFSGLCVKSTESAPKMIEEMNILCSLLLVGLKTGMRKTIISIQIFLLLQYRTQ